MEGLKIIMDTRGTQLQIINPALTIDWLVANSTGEGVEVAIIDSGIDSSHPALKGKVKSACIIHDRGGGKIEYEETPGKKSYDSFGHGSGVAGIITDIAPDAELISVKVLGENNTGSGEALIAGLQWALDHKIKLINMSRMGTTMIREYSRKPKPGVSVEYEATWPTGRTKSGMIEEGRFRVFLRD